MKYVEAHGHSLIRDKKEKALDHLRIYGSPGATPEQRRWTVESHYSAHGDRNPESHDFGDGLEMLRHVAASANVREGDE